MVRDAFVIVDNLHIIVHEAVQDHMEVPGGTNANMQYVDSMDVEELIQKSTQPLHKGCLVNCL
jgi:hypothetical protein